MCTCMCTGMARVRVHHACPCAEARDVLGRQVGCGHDPLQLPSSTPSGSLRGATPLHVLLAHCDWAAWPPSCRAALQHRAAQLPHVELAAVHALALQPTAETAALASQLLACGARADVVLTLTLTLTPTLTLARCESRCRASVLRSVRTASACGRRQLQVGRRQGYHRAAPTGNGP